MKITYIGDCYSVFISQLAEEMKKYNYFDKINGFMLTKPVKRQNAKYDNFQCSRISSSHNKRLKILWKTIKYFETKRKIKQNGFSDIINIHYITPHIKYFWSDIKKQSNVVILSIWGSDFYRANIKTREKMRKIIDECDAITFTNEIMARDFCDFYDNLDISNKIYINRFGLKPLEYLSNINISIEEAKNYFNFPTNKPIVTIGYSSSFGHQHEKIIKHLKHLEIIKDKVHIVFPMTYGDFSYRENIEHILSFTDLDFTLLKSFMPYEDVAKLRLASDIMINVQISDQFSGSMQEYLYAGSVVITGSWLPYNTFWENGVFALQIQNISELNDMLNYALNNLDYLKEKSKKNKDIIWELSSWGKNAPKWLDMYKDLMEKSKNPDGIN